MAPVVALVARTEAVPENVKTFDGESREKLPLVWMVTPVKVTVLEMEPVIGVTATSSDAE